MRNTISLIFLIAVFSLQFVSADNESFEIILKTGKVIKGSLLTETEEMFVVEDSSGVRMNIKKNRVDLEKTAAANVKPEEPPPSQEPEPAPEEKQTQSPSTETKKKPARVFSEKDLHRLREKYPMESGSVTINETGNVASGASNEERSDEEWRADAQALYSRVKKAQEIYNQLKNTCERLKGITVQTHRLKDADTGKTLNMAETREEVCGQAEEARQQYQSAKQDYNSLVQAAREHGIPPGYLPPEE